MAEESIDFEKTRRALSDCIENLDMQKIDEVYTQLNIFKNTWNTPCKKTFLDALGKIKKEYGQLNADLTKYTVEISTLEVADTIEKNAKK
ncbi:MAG: hypothetical protein IKE73_03825 [Bacilli bacterium]|nr:hypothetical protein [Bacilli bacterium]